MRLAHGRDLQLGERTLLMGVLNVTPDSFSDGGRYLDPGAACDAAQRMARDGADLIDVGGESTRPGAAPVDAGDERARVIPVIARLARELAIPLTIDTLKASVAQAALDAGAAAVNDMSALRHDPDMAAVAARRGAGLVLGHMRGTPRTMQDDPRYDDVVADVARELRHAVDAARAAGVAADAIAVDPGFGFGKRFEHNMELLRRLDELRAALPFPVVVGLSRKSFTGRLTGDPVERRLPASLAAMTLAIAGGADIVRVHDVAESRQAALLADAVVRTAGAPRAREVRSQP